MAARHGVGERVKFLPPSRDVGTLLKSVDALAVLSQNEGFPMVVVEAGLTETPVIATQVGALPELFADEILFVDLEHGEPSIECFLSALARLDRRWGRRLHERVSSLCAKESVVAQYVELVESVWENRPAAFRRRDLVKWKSSGT